MLYTFPVYGHQGLLSLHSFSFSHKIPKHNEHNHHPKIKVWSYTKELHSLLRAELDTAGFQKGHIDQYLSYNQQNIMSEGWLSYEHWDEATHGPRTCNAHSRRSLTAAIILSRNKSNAQTQLTLRLNSEADTWDGHWISHGK